NTISEWSKLFSEADITRINRFIGDSAPSSDRIQQAAYDFRLAYYQEFGSAIRALLSQPQFRGRRIVFGGGLILNWGNDPAFVAEIEAIRTEGLGEILLSNVPDNEHAAVLPTRRADARGLLPTARTYEKVRAFLPKGSPESVVRLFAALYASI